METTMILNELLKNARVEFETKKLGQYVEGIDREEVEGVDVYSENDTYLLDECVLRETEAGDELILTLWDKEMREGIELTEGDLKMVKKHLNGLWEAENARLENQYQDGIYEYETHEEPRGWFNRSGI